MLWLFIFHSLQVYRNRWTKWFWIWVDVSTKERNGGVGTTYLASRTNARLSQIRLPVRYCRVKYAFSCFHSEGPHLFHNATLVLSILNQILGIIFVWEPKRVCSLRQPSLLGTKPSCSSGNSKSLVLKSLRYRTVIKHRNLAQWFFVFPALLVSPSLGKKTSFAYPEMAEEHPAGKVSLPSRRAVTSKTVAVPSQASLFPWSVHLGSSNACEQGAAEMRKCQSRKRCQGWEG